MKRVFYLLALFSILAAPLNGWAWLEGVSSNTGKVINGSGSSGSFSATDAGSYVQAALPENMKINYGPTGQVFSYEIPITAGNNTTILSIDSSYKVRGETTFKNDIPLSAQEISAIYSMAKNALENWPDNTLLVPSEIAVKNYGDDTFNRSDYRVKAGDDTLQLNISSLLRNMDMNTEASMNTFLLVKGLAAYTWEVKKATAEEEGKESPFIRNWKLESGINDNAQAEEDFSLNIANYYQHRDVLDYAKAQAISKFFLVTEEAGKVWTYSIDTKGGISAQKNGLILIKNTDSEDEDNPDYGKTYTVPENMRLIAGWEKIN